MGPFQNFADQCYSIEILRLLHFWRPCFCNTLACPFRKNSRYIVRGGVGGGDVMLNLNLHYAVKRLEATEFKTRPKSDF